MKGDSSITTRAFDGVTRIWEKLCEYGKELSTIKSIHRRAERYGNWGWSLRVSGRKQRRMGSNIKKWPTRRMCDLRVKIQWLAGNSVNRDWRGKQARVAGVHVVFAKPMFLRTRSRVWKREGIIDPYSREMLDRSEGKKQDKSVGGPFLKKRRMVCCRYCWHKKDWPKDEESVWTSVIPESVVGPEDLVGRVLLLLSLHKIECNESWVLCLYWQTDKGWTSNVERKPVEGQPHGAHAIVWPK